MVICLERGADLHMAQLMSLPLTVSCFSKIQIGFTFLVPAHLGSPGQRAVKRVCVCVCVFISFITDLPGADAPGVVLTEAHKEQSRSTVGGLVVVVVVRRPPPAQNHALHNISYKFQLSLIDRRDKIVLCRQSLTISAIN